MSKSVYQLVYILQSIFLFILNKIKPLTYCVLKYALYCDTNTAYTGDFMDTVYPLHFVDIETTCLDPQDGYIIEIAILTSLDGGRTINSTFESKIKPQDLKNANPKAMQINGYREREWRDAPQWSEIAPQILQILKYGIIVAHNVMFDWTWLDYHIKSSTGGSISYLKICTQSLVWVNVPNTKSASLSKMRDIFGMSHDKSHTALKDIQDTHHLFLQLVYPQHKIIQTLRDRLQKRRDADLHVVGVACDEMDELLSLFPVL